MPDGAAAVRQIIDAAAEIAVDYPINVERLARLPRHEYDRCRKAEATRLGVRMTTLDGDVERARGPAIEPAGNGLIRAEPEPWPAPVDGAALLEEIAVTIARYVVAGEGVFDALALWVVHAHAYDAMMVSPRLVVTSPEKRCGKTTVLTLIGALVPRALHAASISPAALFRSVDAMHPTIVIDEGDTFIPGNDELRGIVNAGHFKPTATVVRVVERGSGDFQPCAFSAWSPVVIAAIGHLPGTIEDRAVVIAMRRRRRDEPVERLRLDRLDALKPLAARAARWAGDHAATLARSDPTVPAELHDRAADNWRVLIAIADLAGGDWPQRARRAALALSAGRETELVRTLLLADLRELFDREPSGVLFTEEILPALGLNDNRPWPEWRHGKPITARQLSRLLRPLGAISNTVRRADRTGKGYRRSDLADAFERYCDGSADFVSVTPSQPAESATCDGKSPVTSANFVTATNPSQPAESATCDGVTANGLPAGKGNGSPVFYSSLLADIATGEIDDERVAIAEIDGGLPRADAELIARLPDRPPVGMTEADLDELIAQLENET